MGLYDDAKEIYTTAINDVMPNSAVKKAMEKLPKFKGKLILIAIGKASWEMASSAMDIVGDKVSSGVVITKYNHSKGKIGNLKIFEAGHPVPDEKSYLATEYVINLVKDLTANDLVLFLISGGGSALFEKPLLPQSEMESITNQLLSCGADITEINILRKRFSSVKGGKFAKICYPAKVFGVALSDVLGDIPHMIASGPISPDPDTSKIATKLVEKYNIKLSPTAKELLEKETPKEISNAELYVVGSVSKLCESAKSTAEKLGYKSIILSDNISCEAKALGKYFGTNAQIISANNKKTALIVGGETVVKVTGNGKGGRNQEIALSFAKWAENTKNCLLFSVGSDGTDGPTDAAGGITDGSTKAKLQKLGIDIDDVLSKNDSYNALQKVDGLIVTGPTGTNVNDLTVLLVNGQ